MKNLRYLCLFALLLSLTTPAPAQVFGLPGDPCETGFVDCDLDPDPDPLPEFEGEPGDDYAGWEDCVAAGDCESEEDLYYDSWADCVAAGDCEPLTAEQEACATDPTCGLPEDSLHWDDEVGAFSVPDLRLHFDPETSEWFDARTGKVLTAEKAKEAAGNVKDRDRIRRLLRSTTGGPVGLVVAAIRELF